MLQPGLPGSRARYRRRADRATEGLGRGPGAGASGERASPGGGPACAPVAAFEPGRWLITTSRLGAPTSSRAAIRLRPVAWVGRPDSAASSTWARFAPPRYGMQSRRRPVSGSSWTEWIGTMCVCWNRARTCGSSPSGSETLRATRRPARSTCSAR
ncbi:MAG: hypothetical protein U0800_16355 [Isosphaeraceae bacterium]